MHRLAVVPAVLLAVLAVSASSAPALAAASPGTASVSYRAPVDGPVVDPFRPPPEPWAAGNRGLEYATAEGAPVRAAADGEVVFAGPVAGSLHVVVLHADGIRTSYSFLRSISVHRGDRVRQGDAVGTSGERLHFGARAGDTYIDPAGLLAGDVPEVHLVADGTPHRASEARERGGLARMLARLPLDALRAGAAGAAVAGGAVARGAASAGDAVARASAAALAAQAGRTAGELRAALLFGSDGLGLVRAAHLAVATLDWWAHPDCTPSDVPNPVLTERHAVVLVAGLGSSSTQGAVDDVPVESLGYRPDDRYRFSYRGDGATYGPHDTTVDLRLSGRRLRELLERVAAERPGVPVDIVAHSQGGLVVRSALAHEVDRHDPRLPPIRSVVTLGTPHQGTNLATTLTNVGLAPGGQPLLAGVHALRPGDVDPRGMSIRQMDERSNFLRRLNSRPLPRGVRFTSIGASGDFVVPAPRTHLAGARNVLVSPPGLNDHQALPGSAPADREIALALSGRPPACRSLVSRLTDEVMAQGIAEAEDALTLSSAVPGLAYAGAAPRLPFAPPGTTP